MIPDEKVREVAERTSIVDVIADYVPLRKAGANFVGLCPFHGEKTASFNVNPAREIFHCFGCGAGGNVFSFLMKIEGITFPEAVKLAARRAGITIEERQLTAAEQQEQQERQVFQRINERAADYYRQILTSDHSGETGRAYLAQRGVDAATGEAYRIGFAPERGDGLVKLLQKEGFDLQLAQKLGIVKHGDRGWYDQFRNRLMFPIRDPKGNVIAFAGRVLDASLPKYINSPESPLYHKSSVFFGLDMALPTIRVDNSVIVVEGYFDHLALFQAGVKNVVATCGTALTASHAAMIKRHAQRVYLLFDGDGAGRKAAVRSMEIFMEQRLPSYIVTLPAGDDPDSFLKQHSVEQFNGCLKSARPAFESYIRALVAQQKPDSVDSKVRIIDELLPRFKKIADPVERDLYENEICRLLGITVHAFRKRSGGRELSSRDMLAASPAQGAGAIDTTQETLLALICNYPAAAVKIRELGIENVLDGAYAELGSLLLAAADDSGEIPGLQNLCESIERPEIRTLLSRILVSDATMADIDWKTALSNCLRSREKRSLSSIKDIATLLATTPPDSPEYHALIRQADELRTRKSKILP